MRSLLATLLAGAALALVACGDDDSGEKATTTERTETTATGEDRSSAGRDDGGERTTQGGDRSSSGRDDGGARGDDDGGAPGEDRPGRGRRRSGGRDGDDSGSKRGDDSAARPERKFHGVDRSNYEVSETVCGSLRRSDAARRYQAESERPEDIARAYARITYKIPRLRRAGYEGCLAGLTGP